MLMTVNQEDSKKSETDRSSGNLMASTDVFFLSPEDSCSQEEAPIIIRKRKALRSLSREPAKKTRSQDPDHDPAAGSLPLSESASHLSPPSSGGRGSRSGRVPSARATRSLPPQHYVVIRQQVSRVTPLEDLEPAAATVQQSIPENSTKSATDLPVAQMQKEQDSSKAGMDETERGTGEQIQTSNDAPEQKEDGLAYFLSMGEEDKTNMDTEEDKTSSDTKRDSKLSPAKVLHSEESTKEIDQSEAMDCTKVEHSPRASHDKEKKATMMEQGGTEAQVISITATQEKAATAGAKPSKSETAKSTTTTTTATTCKGSEVSSPRRYSTRRLGITQGSTVEKLTQSYTSRLEQALGSPDALKKKPLALQSPKRSTPKGAKASPKALPVKSGGSGGKVGRRSRGGARGKAEIEVEGRGRGGEGEKGETEKGEGGGGGEDDEGIIKGADSQAVSEPTTPLVGAEKQGEQNQLGKIYSQIPNIKCFHMPQITTTTLYYSIKLQCVSNFMSRVNFRCQW